MQNETPRPQTDDFELKTNSTLEKVLDEIKTMPVEWEALVKKVQAHRLYRQRKLTVSGIRSLFSELHYQHTLQNIAEHTPQVISSPIHHDISSKGLRFEYNNLGQLVVVNEETNELWCEMDAVIVANHLPVVFEIKLSHDTAGSHYRSVTSRRRIQELGRAMHAYFDTHSFGYAVTTYRGHSNDVTSPLARLRNFGGKVIEFPYDEQEYTRQLVKITHAHKIHIAHERQSNRPRK